MLGMQATLDLVTGESSVSFYFVFTSIDVGCCPKRASHCLAPS